MLEWRDIPGYENLYQVSWWGQVQSVRRNRLLSLVLTRSGYLNVNLYRAGNVRHFQVHRLVASAFLGDIPPGYVVNHKDGNKSNNCVENLEIVTAGENSEHARRTGLTPSVRGEANPKAKLTEEQVREMRRLRRRGAGVTALAGRFGISRRVAYKILNRELWPHVT